MHSVCAEVDSRPTTTDSPGAPSTVLGACTWMLIMLACKHNILNMGEGLEYLLGALTPLVFTAYRLHCNNRQYICLKD